MTDGLAFLQAEMPRRAPALEKQSRLSPLFLDLRLYGCFDAPELVVRYDWLAAFPSRWCIVWTVRTTGTGETGTDRTARRMRPKRSATHIVYWPPCHQRTDGQPVVYIFDLDGKRSWLHSGLFYALGLCAWVKTFCLVALGQRDPVSWALETASVRVCRSMV